MVYDIKVGPWTQEYIHAVVRATDSIQCIDGPNGRLEFGIKWDRDYASLLRWSKRFRVFEI